MNFLRLIRDKLQRISGIQTPKVPFKHSSGILENVELHFVGTMHSGDRRYYLELMKILEHYDLVFFESVMPQFAIDEQLYRKRELAGVRAMRAGLAQGMEAFLGLGDQIDYLHYISERFVHADISTEELDEHLANHGGEGDVFYVSASSTTAFSDVLVTRMMDRWPSPNDMIRSIGRGDLYREARRAYCQWMFDGEFLLNESMKAVLFEPREAIVMSRLEERLMKHDPSKALKVAILYGAGHYDSLATQLWKRLGFIQEGEWEWVTAIEIDPNSIPTPEHYIEAKRIFDVGEW